MGERSRPARRLARALLAALLGLAALARGAEPQLLDPEQAFRFSARLRDARSVEVRYSIAPGYYLYREKLRFSAEPASVRLGPPQLPRGTMTRDAFFGESEVYRGEFAIVLPFELDDASLAAFTLAAVSQGCADAGVCYLPQQHRAEIALAALGAPAAAASAGSAVPGAEEAGVASLFAGSFWLLVASFFGFGLLLAFTPCMLPMVPILAGVLVGGAAPLGRARALALAAAYVFGMALTYALAGVAAGLSGAMLAAALQHPWVLAAFGLLFVALALSMFGLYELQLPVALQSRLAQASRRIRSGHAGGAAAMGVLSALMLGPCVAAPLAGALLYIGQSRDVALGGAALFAMGLGMGAPLLAMGASAGALLPKAGAWMETVKRVVGVVLLGMAIYVVSPLLAPALHMLAWAALLILTAVYLRALDPLPSEARGFERLVKGVGVIALVTGIALLVGALSGGRDVLQPLSGLRQGAAESAPTPFQRVGSVAELEQAVRAAAGRPVMLDFYADWCVSCQEMERFTFRDPRVRARLRELVLLQADVTANGAAQRELLRRFRLFGPPGIVFFDRAGREIAGLRVIGFQPAERFAAVLDQALSYR